MFLASALVAYVIKRYLKLFSIIAPIGSLWEYHSSSKQSCVILLELVLTLVTISIVHASLALTKMGCQRIANYLILPVLVTSAYLNFAYYHKRKFEHLQEIESRNQSLIATSGLDVTIASETQPRNLGVHHEEDSSIISRVELSMSNGLALLTIIQVTANIIGAKLI